MRALIFANGDPASREVVARWRQPDSIAIAADGGARNAVTIGVTPQTVIGDLDSLDGGLRADLEARGVRFIVYPTHKDETDLELAIRHALERGATDIVIFSALGGRWDQSLGNVLLLTSPALRDVPARLVDLHQTMTVVRSAGEARIEGRPGDTLSLIALGGDARGVTIEGCEYPLSDAVLPFGATLGISNTLIAPEARVRVRDGIVLIVHSRNE
jgi:thiamine pyrophosphokinase